MGRPNHQDVIMNYFYLPPAEWPPKDYDRPPVDDWTPPMYWEPRDRLPLSPLGALLVMPPPSDKETSKPPLSVEEQDENHRRVVRRMLAMWARAVQADAHSYWKAAMRAAWMDWAIDKMEEWSLDEICPPHWSKSGCAATSSSCRPIRWNGGCRRIAGSTVSKSSRGGTKIYGMPLIISRKPGSRS